MRKQIIKPNISKTLIRINWNKTRENQTECGTHIHDEYELTTCVYGSILYTINDKEYLVREGDVIFVNSNVPHATTAMENTYYIPIILRGETDNKKLFYHDTFRFMEQDAVFIKKDTIAAQELYNCIVTTKNDFSEKKPFYEEYVKADAKKLLAIMYRYSLITKPKRFILLLNIFTITFKIIYPLMKSAKQSMLTDHISADCSNPISKYHLWIILTH